MFDEKYVEIFKEQSKIFEQEFTKNYGYIFQPEIRYFESHAFHFWTSAFTNEELSLRLDCGLYWVKKLERYGLSFMIWLHPNGDVAIKKCFELSEYEKQVGRKLVRREMREGQDITEFCQNYYADLRILLEGELKNILIGKEFIEHDKWCGK